MTRSLFDHGSHVRVRDDSPTAWGGQTGVVKVVYEAAAHVQMDSSKTPVLFFLSELEDATCVCGHTAEAHSDYEDVPCEGSHFVAPGSFVACECPGFRAFVEEPRHA